MTELGAGPGRGTGNFLGDAGGNVKGPKGSDVALAIDPHVNKVVRILEDIESADGREELDRKA
jgi:hypothetical protein